MVTGDTVTEFVFLAAEVLCVVEGMSLADLCRHLWRHRLGGCNEPSWSLGRFGTESVGYTNRYRLTTWRYPGVHSFQCRKTIVKVGLKTPEGVRRPSSAWLTGIIVILHMLLDMDVTSHGLLATRSPLICCCGLRRASLYCGEHRSCSRAVRIVFGASPAAWNGKLSVFAFSAVVNAQWQCM